MLVSPTRRLYWPDNLLPQYRVLKDSAEFWSVDTEPVAPAQSLTWPPPAPLSKQRIWEAPGMHGHHTWQERAWVATGCSPGCRSHSRSPSGKSKNSSQVHPMGFSALGICPMSSSSACMESTPKYVGQKLPLSTAAPSSLEFPSHCFFLLTSWQVSCMPIRQDWVLT